MGKPEESSSTWLVTYGDLVTLLLVFFVLLYTLTPGVEDAAFDSFITYFQKSGGIFEDSGMSPQGAMKQEALEDSLVEAQREERWQAFADFLEEHNLSSEVDIKQVGDGVRITLSDSLTFESGSSELLPGAKDVLTEMAKILDSAIPEIEVQGHTDNVPISSSSLYKTNWHLGAARAVSVVQFLESATKLAPDRFKASSFGQYRPVTTNETKDGRRKNRRVEIYIRDRDLPNIENWKKPIVKIGTAY